MKEFETYTLPNGIRGIHRQTRSNVAHCALVVNAGSRDERRSEYGIAHFTEHALFKGTRRRRAYQVNCRLENLGGELNAYTTKEDTTLHATTLRSDFSKAVELIADIAFHSTFPERELAKEREVIADEINTYKDSPAEMIYDSFEDMIFADSELGTQHPRQQGFAGALHHAAPNRLRQPYIHHRPNGLLVDRRVLSPHGAADRHALPVGGVNSAARLRKDARRSIRPVPHGTVEAYPPDALHHRQPRLRAGRRAASAAVAAYEHPGRTVGQFAAEH